MIISSLTAQLWLLMLTLIAPRPITKVYNYLSFTLACSKKIKGQVALLVSEPPLSSVT